MTAAVGSGPVSDREFRVRMGLALALVVCLPFVFIYTFVFLANTVGIALMEWVNERPYPGEFYVDPMLVGVAVLGGLVLQYRYGPRAALDSVTARRATADEYPELHATLTRLAAQVDLATPNLAVIRTEAPNAFAVAGGSIRGVRGGAVGDTSTIVVTTTLLELLDDEELEAVLAHELAPVKPGRQPDDRRVAEESTTGPLKKARPWIPSGRHDRALSGRHDRDRLGVIDRSL